MKTEVEIVAACKHAVARQAAADQLEEVGPAEGEQEEAGPTGEEGEEVEGWAERGGNTRVGDDIKPCFGLMSAVGANAVGGAVLLSDGIDDAKLREHCGAGQEWSGTQTEQVLVASFPAWRRLFVQDAGAELLGVTSAFREEVLAWQHALQNGARHGPL